MKKVKTNINDKIELHKGTQQVRTPNGVQEKKASAIKIGDVLDCCGGIVVAVGYDVCVTKKL